MPRRALVKKYRADWGGVAAGRQRCAAESAQQTVHPRSLAPTPGATSPRRALTKCCRCCPSISLHWLQRAPFCLGLSALTNAGRPQLSAVLPCTTSAPERQVLGVVRAAYGSLVPGFYPAQSHANMSLHADPFGLVSCSQSALQPTSCRRPTQPPNHVMATAQAASLLLPPCTI